MPGSGADEEDEAVAASYDGGGSLGAWAADMLQGFGAICSLVWVNLGANKITDSWRCSFK